MATPAGTSLPLLRNGGLLATLQRDEAAPLLRQHTKIMPVLFYGCGEHELLGQAGLVGEMCVGMGWRGLAKTRMEEGYGLT